MFGLLVPNKILRSAERNETKEEKHRIKVLRVVNNVGYGELPEKELFRRLLKIGAISNNWWGKWRFRWLIEWGIPDEEDPRSTKYRFIPLDFDKPGQEKYQLQRLYMSQE